MKYTLDSNPKVDRELDMLVLSQDNLLKEMSLYSVGLARSVKLDEVEAEIERFVSEAHKINFGPIQAREGGRLCRRKLSEIYQLESKMTSNLLKQEPGFLWDAPASQSKLFLEQCSYLDLQHRLDRASERLQLPRSFWELENDHFRLKQGWRLEIIIIGGICAEIVIAALEMFWLT